MENLDNLQAVSLGPWQLGMAVRPAVYDTPPGSARILQNILLYNRGSVQLRDGIAQLPGWPAGHSPYTDTEGRGWYVADDGAIRTVYTAEDNRDTGVQVDGNRMMSWASFDSRVYYSNGVSYGYFDEQGAHPWGWPTPPPPRVVGTGEAGKRILVSQTALYNGGEESAASNLVAVEGDGAQVTVPSSGAEGFVIYSSRLDGDELYRVRSVPPGTTWQVNPLEKLGRPLTSLDRQPMLAGTIIARFHRYMLSVISNTLYWSTIRQASLTDLRNNWYAFDELITAVIPMEDGCYIGLENELIWCQGADPEDWVFTTRRTTGIIAQPTAQYLPTDLLPAEGRPPGPLSLAWTLDGECLSLRNNGFVADVAPLYCTAPYALASYGYREYRGLKQILTAFQNALGPAHGRYRSKNP